MIGFAPCTPSTARYIGQRECGGTLLRFGRRPSYSEVISALKSTDRPIERLARIFLTLPYLLDVNKLYGALSERDVLELGWMTEQVLLRGWRLTGFADPAVGGGPLLAFPWREASRGPLELLTIKQHSR